MTLTTLGFHYTILLNYVVVVFFESVMLLAMSEFRQYPCHQSMLDMLHITFCVVHRYLGQRYLGQSDMRGGGILVGLT